MARQQKLSVDSAEEPFFHVTLARPPWVSPCLRNAASEQPAQHLRGRGVFFTAKTLIQGFAFADRSGWPLVRYDFLMTFKFHQPYT